MLEYIYFFFNLFVFEKILNLFITDSKSRWFFIHSYGNAIISFICLVNLFPLYNKPAKILDNYKESNNTTILISILHIYHILFFECNKQDLFHHIAFVFIGNIIKFYYSIGYTIYFYQLFICGIPGCVDYFILGLQRLKFISKKKRILIANELNVWIRAPGLISSNTLMSIYFFKHLELSTALLYSVVCYFFTSFNGIYYMRQVFSANEKIKNNN